MIKISKPNESKLTDHQITVLVVFCTVAMNPFIYPTLVNRIMGRSGWILGIINLLAAFLGSMVISYVLRKIQGANFIDWAEQLLGKAVVYGVTLIFVAIVIFNLTITYRVLAEILLVTQLPQTPTWATVATVALSSLYLVLLGIGAMARTSEFYFVFAAPVFLAIVLGRSATRSLHNLQPFTVIPWTNLKDIRVVGSFMAYFGPVHFFLLSHHIPPKAKIGKAMAKAITWSAVVILVSFLLPVLVFGPEMVDYASFPLLEVASTLRFPGTLLERIVFVIVTLWQGVTFVTGAVYHYAAATALSRLSGQPANRLAVLLSPVIIIGALAYKNLAHLFEMYTLWSIIGLSYTGFLLLIIFLAMIIRGGRTHT